MSVDLTHLLPETPATVATAHDEFPGVDLPVLPAEASYGRAVPLSCKNCPAAVAVHKIWNRCQITCATPKLFEYEFIGNSNALIEYVQIVQALIDTMDFVSNGVFDGGALTTGYGNSTLKGLWYPVVSGSGRTLTLKYATTCSNPANISWNAITLNPDWPGEGGRISSTTYNNSLPPRGQVSFVGNILQHQGQMRILSVTVDPDIVEGGTFTLTVDGDVSHVDELYPDSYLNDPWGEAASVALVEFYTLSHPAWITPRKIYPFWGEQKIVETSLGGFPEDGIFELLDGDSQSARIIPNSTWFKLEFLISTIWHDYTAQGLSHLTIAHSGGGYQTLCNLSEYLESLAVETVRFTYWYESSENAARYVGQDRCRYSLPDLTGSYGTLENGIKFYCGNAGASGRDDFIPQCYQYGVCDGFAEDAPTSPVDPALWKQLLYSHPWAYVNYPQAGPNPILERFGVPSLGSLCAMLPILPSGPHTIRTFIGIGGWLQLIIVDDFHIPMQGLEFLISTLPLYFPAFGPTERIPKFADASTHPEYGPAGGNWTEKSNDIGDAMTDDDDSLKVGRAGLLASGSTVNPQTGAITGTLGLFCRCDAVQHEVYWPRLVVARALAAEAVLNNIQVRMQGTFEFGWWNASFLRQYTATGAVYFWRAVFAQGIHVDKTQTDAVNGLVGSYIFVGEPDYDAGTKRYTFTVQNGTVSASSYQAGYPVGVERGSTWAQRGVNIPDPDYLQIRNWAAGLGWGANRAGIHAGLLVSMDDADFDPYIKGSRFCITKTMHATGAVQSWIPGGGAAYKTASYQPMRGAHFVKYDRQDGTESIINPADQTSDVTLKRHQIEGVYQVTLTMVTDRPPKPDPRNLMNADNYWIMDGKNADGFYGAWIFVSQANAMTDTDHNTIHYEFKTYFTTGGVYRTYSSGDADFPNIVLHPINTAITFDIDDEVEFFGAVAVASETYGTITLTELDIPPATGGDWESSTQYLREKTGSGTALKDYRFTFHTQFALDKINVQYNPLGNGEENETDFYTKNVAIHAQGLPADHQAEANKSGQFIVQDELDIIHTWIGEGGTFDGKTFNVYRDSFGHPSDDSHRPEVAIGTYGDTVETSLVESTDYDYHGGNRTIWGKTDITASDKCVRAKLYLSDHRAMPRLAEFQALRKTLERTMG